jgi:HEAT repeat protein
VKHSSALRPLAAAVWLIGVLALVPASRAQNKDESGKTNGKSIDNPDEFGNTVRKSIDNIQKALQSPSPARQYAGLSLAGSLKLTPAQSGEMIGTLLEFLPKANTEDVQVAWLLAYGRLHLNPEGGTEADAVWRAEYVKFPRRADFAKQLQPFIDSPSLRVRQAAAESLGYLLIAALQWFDKPSVTPRTLDRDFETQQRIALGLATHPIMAVYPWLELFDGTIDLFNVSLEPYLPLIEKALQSSDPTILKAGLDMLRNLAISMSENLPDPGRQEKELVVDPYQAKVKFLLLEPILKKINRLTPNLIAPLRSSNLEVRQMAHRTAEAVANARRLARVTQLYEAFPGDPLVPLPEDEALLPGLRTLLPVLFANLKAADPALRMNAMEALEYYDRAIWGERSYIIRATQDSSLFVRWVAARTLGKMLPNQPKENEQADALKALARLLSDTDIDVRLAALAALQRWGEYGVGASEAVIACVNRGDVDSRLAAIATLEAIKSDPNPATTVLVEALGQEDFRVRRAAAATLGRMGEKAKAAVPALEKVLLDPDPELRRLASEAILAIE